MYFKSVSCIYAVAVLSSCVIKEEIKKFKHACKKGIIACAIVAAAALLAC
jgi:hypothetical protein